MLFVSCQLLHSQVSEIIPYSPSIAQSSVADVQRWSAFSNPAMLGYIDNSELAILVENRYLLPELSTKCLQVGIVTNAVNAGLSFSHFGYSLYHEMLVGLGFGRNFGDKFSMGVQFDYYTVYYWPLAKYKSTLLPQIGISMLVSPSFSIGFHSFNPFQSTLSTDYVSKRIPSIFSLGTSYNFSSELVWRTQIDKEISSNYRFASGFEYWMLDALQVKLGAYASEYLVPCIGMAFKQQSSVYDFNCEMHPLLGINILVGVKFQFKAARNSN
jgi:hypothetical protein